MPLQSKGWAFVSCSSGGGGSAQGPTGSLQFHSSSGTISGSANLIFNTGSSPNRLFLTGALLVNGDIVATNFDVVNHTISYLSSSGASKFGNSTDDLHQFTGSVQTSGAANSTLFRVDGGATSPVIFATGSGQVAIGHDSPECALSVNGCVEFGNGSGLGYLMSRGDPDTHLRFSAAGLGSDSMALVAGGKAFITIDNNATSSNDYIILGTTSTDNTYVSGNLFVCDGTASIAHLSGCSPIQLHAPITSSYSITASNFVLPVGSGVFSGSTGVFTTISASAIVGGSPLSISSSATTVTGSLAVSDLDEGGILFAGASGELSTDVDSLQWTTDRGDNDGYLSLVVSSSASGSAALGDGLFMMTDENDDDICFISADGAEFAVDSTFDGTVNLKAAVTSSDVIVSTTAPSAGPGLWVSSSNPALGGGNESYAGIWLGSGSMGGGGFSGAAIGLSNFYNGGETLLTIRSKAGNLTLQSDAGDTTVKATDGEVILSGSTRVISHTDHNFQALATFNAGATFNGSLVANGDVTLGDSGSDGVTWNAGSWNMGANSVVTTLKDGVDGLSGNGALMFWTGSGGDFMKFHTSGSAKGIVFPQETYLSRAGALSGTAAGPGSFLALDVDKKIILATPAGGGGGSTVDTTTDTSSATFYVPFVNQSTGQSGETVYIHDVLSINPSSSLVKISETGNNAASLVISSSTGKSIPGGRRLGSIGFPGAPGSTDTSTLIAGGYVDFGGGDWDILTIHAPNNNGVIQISASNTIYIEGDAIEFEGSVLANNGFTSDGEISGSEGILGATAKFGGLNFEGNKVLTSDDGTIMFGATADQDLRANSLFLSGGLEVGGNVTLGDAGGDSVTVNASSWGFESNDQVWKLADNSDGFGGNGPLLIFTGSGGDLLKFSTSGSRKGVVFPTTFYPGSDNGADIGDSTYRFGNLYLADTAVIHKGVVIGTGSAPMITLDVHYTGSGSPVNLSNDTGGGEVVYFGTSSAGLSTGAVYFLNKQGGWQSVDSATTGSGHNQLLGIALGTKAADHGVLVRGYFDVHTHYSGSFIKGGAVYIQSSSAGRTTTGGGYLSGAAPSAADSYVRVVGYGTDTANVIYFNPDSTYIELA